MLNKILSLIIVLSVIIAIVIGLIFRPSYTNLTAESDVYSSFSVALWDLEMSPDIVEAMSRELPNSNLILRVKSNGKMGYTFKNNKQYVEVLEIYQGNGLEIGDQIAISSMNWLFFFDDMTANMGFINIMQPENEYLVFLERKIKTLESNEEIYLIPDFILAPIYNYEDQENKIIHVQEDNRYVPYNEVRNNEFHVSSESALNSLTDLKQKLIKEYPR